MTIHRSSSVHLSPGGALLGLLMAICLGLFLPDSAAAQCAGCAGDFEEGTIECASLPVGAAFCIAGADWVPPKDDETEGTWVSWCFSGGPSCEWIMHLDFSEDGTAYAQKSAADSKIDRRLMESTIGDVQLETCDGVILGSRPALGDGGTHYVPINIEL